MHQPLRYSLIITSIGGGFAGLSHAVQTLFLDDLPTSTFVLTFLVAGFFAFVIFGGLAIIDDSRRVAPLIASFAIQIPVFLSSLVSFKLGVGLPIYLAFSRDGARIVSKLGFDYTFSVLERSPLIVGVNLFSLGMLVWLLSFVVMGRRAPNQALERTDSAG
jgi:hypothetical protein